MLVVVNSNTHMAGECREVLNYSRLSNRGGPLTEETLNCKLRIIFSKKKKKSSTSHLEEYRGHIGSHSRGEVPEMILYTRGEHESLYAVLSLQSPIDWSARSGLEPKGLQKNPITSICSTTKHF